METPAHEIVLSAEREKILSSLYKGKVIKSSEIHKDKYTFLIYYALIMQKDGNYVISEKGRQYILTHKKDNFRFWFPSVVSVIALIISIIALFCD